MKMHEDEIIVTEKIVESLLNTQYPAYSNLPIVKVEFSGTDNALFRLGEDYVVRMPRIDWAVSQIELEFKWLPKFRQHLPIQIPDPIHKGVPAEGYPWNWSIYRWIVGNNCNYDQLADPNRTAVQLAEFIQALQEISTQNAPAANLKNKRGVPLSYRNEITLKGIEQCGKFIDQKIAVEIWTQALKAGDFNEDPKWFHGDLLNGNLIFKNGELRAVIDFSCLAVGDPYCDLLPAWSLFGGDSQALFLSELGCDDAMFQRARGFALSQAVVFIPYYIHSNPKGVQQAVLMLNEIVNEFKND